MRGKERFSGRIGFVLAALGMAIGAGNIWRFPRIAAQYGSEEHGAGAFIVAWLIFLCLWSIPIMIAEFTLGKVTRHGPIGAFSKLLGKPAAWMGAFMAFTTLMIACYYSVVTGWTLKYFVASLSDFSDLAPPTDPQAISDNYRKALDLFTSFAGTTESLLFHLAMVVIAVLIVWRGIKTGVELLCKILMPTLFLLLMGGVYMIFRSDPGGAALDGLNYLFDPDWNQLREPGIWIDALAQSAWSTGAGWGLILAYGAYTRRDEDAVVNNTTAALGNNFASILVGLFLFPAMFSLLSAANLGDPAIRAALRDNTQAGTGMVFQYVPFIFKNVPEYGSALTITFFAALFIAALSSLIAMYEMGIRVVEDLGASRHTAVIIIALIIAAVGGACALDMRLFISMDWVWGVGLIIGGLAVVWAVQGYGTDRFRRKLINETGADVKLGFGFNWFFLFIVPAQGIALLWWFLHHATTEAWRGSADPWDPFALGSTNAGTCVFWWGAALLVFMLLSPWLGKWSLRKTPEEEDPAEQEGSPS